MSKRIKFFIGHLSASLLIACVVVILVFMVWYPTPLFKAVGVGHILLIVLIVDTFIGPLLGLVVYKQDKKKLTFDMTIIVILQVSALSFGVYSLAQGRPAWIVFHNDRFELIRKNELMVQNPARIFPTYQKPPLFGIGYAAVEKSKTIQQQNDDLFMEALGGVSLAQMPERYTDISKVTDQVKQQLQDFSVLKKYNNSKRVIGFLQTYPEANAWLPLKASELDMVVLINKDQGKIVKIVDLRPW